LESHDAIRLGLKSHHRKSTNFAFRKDDGSIATTDEENIAVLEAHFTKVFNNCKNVNFDILDKLKKHPTLFKHDYDISYTEFEVALESLANNKSPGENEVSHNLIKALDDNNRRILYNFIVEFWEGMDYESWHSGLLLIIHKLGRDKSGTNSFRGINLMDVVSKVLSIVINKRLFKILDAHCTKFQFGGTPGIGCREGIFTLKTLLHLRRNHNLSASVHVAFIDLVKAYDTADHKLLIDVLEIYGVPPKICTVIGRLYKDLKVVFVSGKHKVTIHQSVGVRQGTIWPLFYF
jgi:hypothetical protein